MRAFSLVLALAAIGAQGPYRILNTFPVGGSGGWDYIVPDPPNHRLFIGRSDRLMAVDENDGRLLGEVTGIKGAHGAAIVAADGRGIQGTDGQSRAAACGRRCRTQGGDRTLIGVGEVSGFLKHLKI